MELNLRLWPIRIEMRECGSDVVLHHKTQARGHIFCVNDMASFLSQHTVDYTNLSCGVAVIVEG